MASLGQVPVALEGKSRAEVEAALRQPSEGANNMMLQLDETKYGSRPNIDCTFFSGPKASCDFTVPYDDRVKDRDEILAYLDATWGTPARSKPDERIYRVAGHTIRVSDWSNWLKFNIDQ
jgi:hypothetical protein